MLSLRRNFLLQLICLLLSPTSYSGTDSPLDLEQNKQEVALTADQAQFGRYLLHRMGFIVDPLASQQFASLSSGSIPAALSLFSMDEKSASKSLSYLLQRFRLFKQELIEAVVEKNIKQVVLLGAGNSPLPLVVNGLEQEIYESAVKNGKDSSLPLIWEVDTEQQKLLAKHQKFANPPFSVNIQNLRAVEMWLPGNPGELLSLLENSGFDSSKPSIVLAQGLVSYISVENNLLLEQVVNELVGNAPGSVYVVDAFNYPALLYAGLVKGLYQLGEARQIEPLMNTVARTGFTKEMAENFKSGFLLYGQQLQYVKREDYIPIKRPGHDLKKSLRFSHTAPFGVLDQYLIPNVFLHKFYF